MKNSERLTYMTQGDATRSSHYCTGPGVNKDAVVQRLGKYEDTGLLPEELSSAASATEIFTTVLRWYNAVCKGTQECDECPFHVPRKDCFTDGDIEQLIAIAHKYDTNATTSEDGDKNA